MKNFRLQLSILAMMAFLFTSCSKDETGVAPPDSDKASLSFTTVLNDLVSNKAALKQAMDEIPACSDDAPVYVAVVLTGEENIGSTDDPLIVSVNPEPANYDDDPEEEYFTNESTDLELVPGEYTLEYFAVYNGDPADGGQVIWVAPRIDGDLSDFVDAPLPQTFDLGAGAKKYLDVEVLCFDDRLVNEYGYLFFDLETTQAIEFCVFGNFCDEDGRHYPAEFSVSVWNWENGEAGDLIHSGLENSVTMNTDGDWAGTTVCMALPDTAGDDEYYFEITLQDSGAYDAEETLIRSGVISDDEVRELFGDGDEVEYYHFREGNCENGDSQDFFEDVAS